MKDSKEPKNGHGKESSGKEGSGKESHGKEKERSTGAEQTELGQLVSRIAASARALNGAAEDATRKIEALERVLVDAEPGVSVWGTSLLTERANFQREDGASEPAQRVVTLGFARVKKEKWGIAVRDELRLRKGISAQEDVLLLRKADRNLRILALPHLEDLARQVLAALEAQISSLEAARQSQTRASAPSSAPEAAAAASAPSP